ncbi:hypothetical protein CAUPRSCDRAFT_10325 [Caulochytrium protostelioides]|nr:hypothetical protein CAUPRSCDRAFT_10325 [Caulochytrium protostelioides]
MVQAELHHALRRDGDFYGHLMEQDWIALLRTTRTIDTARLLLVVARQSGRAVTLRDFMIVANTHLNEFTHAAMAIDYITLVYSELPLDDPRLILLIARHLERADVIQAAEFLTYELETRPELAEFPGTKASIVALMEQLEELLPADSIHRKNDDAAVAATAATAASADASPNKSAVASEEASVKEMTRPEQLYEMLRDQVPDPAAITPEMALPRTPTAATLFENKHLSVTDRIASRLLNVVLFGAPHDRTGKPAASAIESALVPLGQLSMQNRQDVVGQVTAGYMASRQVGVEDYWKQAIKDPRFGKFVSQTFHTYLALTLAMDSVEAACDLLPTHDQLTMLTEMGIHPQWTKVQAILGVEALRNALGDVFVMRITSRMDDIRRQEKKKAHALAREAAIAELAAPAPASAPASAPAPASPAAPMQAPIPAPLPTARPPATAAAASRTANLTPVTAQIERQLSMGNKLGAVQAASRLEFQDEVSRPLRRDLLFAAIDLDAIRYAYVIWLDIMPYTVEEMQKPFHPQTFADYVVRLIRISRQLRREGIEAPDHRAYVEEFDRLVHSVQRRILKRTTKPDDYPYLVFALATRAVPLEPFQQLFRRNPHMTPKLMQRLYTIYLSTYLLTHEDAQWDSGVQLAGIPASTEPNSPLRQSLGVRSVFLIAINASWNRPVRFAIDTFEFYERVFGADVMLNDTKVQNLLARTLSYHILRDVASGHNLYRVFMESNCVGPPVALALILNIRLAKFEIESLSHYARQDYLRIMRHALSILTDDEQYDHPGLPRGRFLSAISKSMTMLADLGESYPDIKRAIAHFPPQVLESAPVMGADLALSVRNNKLDEAGLTDMTEKLFALSSTQWTQSAYSRILDNIGLRVWRDIPPIVPGSTPTRDVGIAGALPVAYCDRVHFFSRKIVYHLRRKRGVQPDAYVMCSYMNILGQLGDAMRAAVTFGEQYHSPRGNAAGARLDYTMAELEALTARDAAMDPNVESVFYDDATPRRPDRYADAASSFSSSLSSPPSSPMSPDISTPSNLSRRINSRRRRDLETRLHFGVTHAQVSVLIDAFGRSQDAVGLSRVWARLRKDKFPLDENNWTSYIESLVLTGQYSRARETLDSLPAKRNIVLTSKPYINYILLMRATARIIELDARGVVLKHDGNFRIRPLGRTVAIASTSTSNTVVGTTGTLSEDVPGGPVRREFRYVSLPRGPQVEPFPTNWTTQHAEYAIKARQLEQKKR